MVILSRAKEELVGAMQSIMLGETRLWLLRSLVHLRLATWDIYNFAANQADLRIVIKSLDWHTMESALRTKIKDIMASLKIARRKKSDLELKLERERQEAIL